MPSVKLIPAAFDAITTENGLIVENAVPMEPARKMAPTTTMARDAERAYLLRHAPLAYRARPSLSWR